MLKKDNFFKNYFINLSKYNKNLKKTKKVFSSFLLDLKNNQIPMKKIMNSIFQRQLLKNFLNIEILLSLVWEGQF